MYIQGEKGEKGDIGPDGIQGPPGILGLRVIMTSSMTRANAVCILQCVLKMIHRVNRDL